MCISQTVPHREYSNTEVYDFLALVSETELGQNYHSRGFPFTQMSLEQEAHENEKAALFFPLKHFTNRQDWE